MARYDMDWSQIDDISELLQSVPGKGGKAINEVLHGSGGKAINDNIMKLLPVSDEKYKHKHAKDTKPFQQENGQLSVTIRTKYKYHYLYFPDDGTNTDHHAGNQQFMVGGAEASTNKIVDDISTKLTDLLEGKS